MSRYQTRARERNHGCRIREFIYREHACVWLENELVRVLVAADKGTDILEFLHKPTDTDFMWHAPGGLRPLSRFRQSSPLAAGNFREHFAGGWYEMLPNGPAPCTHRGAEFGFHGEATLLPWDYEIVEDEPERIAIKFRVRLVRTPVVVEKTLRLESGSLTLYIHERLTSEAGHAIDVLWGHHPTFGHPFLEEGCRVFLPECKVTVGEQLPVDSRLAPSQEARWSQVRGRNGETIDLSVLPAPETRAHDFVRLDESEEGWFAIVNPRRRVGFALRWDVKVFPVLGFWGLWRGGADYPWYNMHYLAALEPACDLPSLARAAERGTAIKLQPGVPLETELEATAFGEVLQVRSVEAGGVVR